MKNSFLLAAVLLLTLPAMAQVTPLNAPEVSFRVRSGELQFLNRNQPWKPVGLLRSVGPGFSLSPAGQLTFVGGPSSQLYERATTMGVQLGFKTEVQTTTYQQAKDFVNGLTITIDVTVLVDETNGNTVTYYRYSPNSPAFDHLDRQLTN